MKEIIRRIKDKRIPGNNTENNTSSICKKYKQNKKKSTENQKLIEIPIPAFYSTSTPILSDFVPKIWWILCSGTRHKNHPKTKKSKQTLEPNQIHTGNPFSKK